jgi:hypothetical protein
MATALAKERKCEIGFFVDQLKNLDNIIAADRNNSDLMSKLKKHRSCIVSGVNVF